MARIQRDDFHGGYRVTGLEHDVARLQKNSQFNQDMSRIGSQAADAPGDAFAGAVRTTAGIAVGGFAVGVGMVRNRRFRYIMQAVLHFPMAFLIIFFFSSLKSIVRDDYSTMTKEAADAILFQGIGQGALIALVGAIVWTGLYVVLRTRPKLRRLRQY